MNEKKRTGEDENMYQYRRGKVGRMHVYNGHVTPGDDCALDASGM